MLRQLRRPLFTLGLVAIFAIGALGCITRPGATAGPTEQSLLAQVNAHRAAVGVGPLSWCPNLGHAAVLHSADQAARNAMTHTGSDGSSSTVRVERAGYRGWTALAENVAGGHANETLVLAAWLSSPGHRANILNPAFTHMGSGFGAGAGGTLYWTQDFGRGGSC